jgi:hypothetical protein
VCNTVTADAFAGASSDQKGSGNVEQNLIAKVLPGAVADYKKAITGEHGLAEARASLELLSKVRGSLESAIVGHADNEKDFVNAYPGVYACP